MRKHLIIAMVALLAACGGDDDGTPTDPGPQYENIAGTYSGPITGMSQGIALNAQVSVTLTQSGGTLGGSTSIAGTLSDGVDVVQIQGTGTISGTIQSGENPSLSITTTSGQCPNQRMTWSGAYDSTNRIVTITGSIHVLDFSTCQILLSYSGTIIMTR